MVTFLDTAVNTFFSNAGGLQFLGTIFALPIVFAIFISIIRPFNI